MLSEDSGSVYLAEASNQTNPSLQHLQRELARLDILLQRAVRLWQLAGQDVTDAFRGLHISDAGAIYLLQRPFSSSWGQTTALPEVEERAFQQAEQQASLQISTIQEGHWTRLQSLVEAFGLDEFEKDVLLICLAPALDLRYEKIYGYLQDDVTRKRPGLNLVLDLLCPAGLDRLLALSRFSMDAPLFKHRLLERFSEPGQNKSPMLGQSLLIDETIVHWLLGAYRPSGQFVSHLKLTPAFAGSAADEYLDEAISNDPVDILDQDPLFIFSGPDELSQQVAAHSLAQRANQPLLTMDLTPIAREELDLAQAIRIALRDARLTESLLFLLGWDVCLGDGVLTPDLLSELAWHPGILILAGQNAWQPAGLPTMRAIRWREFPLPAYHERETLWKHYLLRTNVAAPLDVTLPASQFALTREQIRDAVALAVNRAAQYGERLSEDALMAAARTASHSQLSNLARKVPPHYTWRDIILPEDSLAQLHEICQQVTHRSRVMEEWGFDRKLSLGKGVTALFAGPSGTGKTMAAEVIANELKLDLYKIDLSGIVSKYIGETEKNLDRIFTTAANANAILLFDEADALFGKRSEVHDAHDRYANIEISYLLQKMEAYEGLAILATNLRQNLDEAFVRRITFSVHFPFPDETNRRLIWQGVWPSQTPMAPGLDLDYLARQFKLSGGNIKNIALAAAFLASADGRKVTMAHILHATQREYQKLGKVLSAAELYGDRPEALPTERN